MPSISREQLKKLHQELPEDIARIYESEETTRAILDTGRKHGLAIDKIGRMSSEIGYVIIGAKPAREFIQNLESALGVPHEKAVLIAREINVRIFAPIRESLKRLHGITPSNPLIDETENTKPQILHPAETLKSAPSATGTQPNRENLSDRAYWDAVKAAGKIENQESPGRTPTAGQAGVSSQGVEEDEKGTLVVTKKKEDEVASKATESELVREVSKLLGEKTQAIGGEGQVIDNPDTTPSPPKEPEEVGVTPELALTPKPSEVAVPAPLSPTPPTTPDTKEAPRTPAPLYGKDPYRESIDDDL